CSIGLVKVVNGIITQKYYSLIKPIPDDRTERTTFIHGITDKMVENAPTFEELFETICSFIGNNNLVCHNKSTDISVMDKCMSYYGLTGINTLNYIDTLELYGRGLEECCCANGIEFINHHDALADAEACAKLYLCYNGHVSMDKVNYNFREIIAEPQEHRKFERDTLTPLSADEVANKETIFFQKKVVITGKFKSYPNRNDLGLIVKDLGADVNTSISCKTHIVIVGSGAGPSKMTKIQNLNNSGNEIRIIYEAELYEILNNI
ncbi:MAG: exonuclease domain-containing protein, partial [Bacteroidales bacterium]